MSALTDAINMAKTASAPVAQVQKQAQEQAQEQVQKQAQAQPKMSKHAAILEALGYDLNSKVASEMPNEMELAKMAAYELAVESLEKLAYAEQLFEEADYVDNVYVKQASDGSDMELDSDGEALEAFLQELESEVDV